jgi:hypothetical protein
MPASLGHEVSNLVDIDHLGPKRDDAHDRFAKNVKLGQVLADSRFDPSGGAYN